jgi:hypothetical protein
MRHKCKWFRTKEPKRPSGSPSISVNDFDIYLKDGYLDRAWIDGDGGYWVNGRKLSDDEIKRGWIIV